MAIAARWRTRSDRVRSSVMPSISGNASTTTSSRPTRPSSIAKPSAVEVKLLLRECTRCTWCSVYGAHQPWATTWPWRTTTKPCSSTSLARSTASRNASTPAALTSWSAGAPTGSGVAPTARAQGGAAGAVVGTGPLTSPGTQRPGDRRATRSSTPTRRSRRRSEQTEPADRPEVLAPRARRAAQPVPGPGRRHHRATTVQTLCTWRRDAGRRRRPRPRGAVGAPVAARRHGLGGGAAGPGGPGGGLPGGVRDACGIPTGVPVLAPA